MSTSLCQSLQLLPLIHSLMNYAPIHRNSVYQRSVTIEKMGDRGQEAKGTLAKGTLAKGTLAIGTLAIGTLAIGTLAIGSFVLPTPHTLHPTPYTPHPTPHFPTPSFKSGGSK